MALVQLNQKLNDVYLVAKIGTIHHQLLPHFLKYYLDEIGIPSDNFIVTVQYEDNEFLDVTLGHLNHYNIKPFEIWQGKFSPVGVMYHFMRMITSVPINKWIIPADVDEFNFRDQSLPQLLKECSDNQYDYASSAVIDMVSDKGIVDLIESKTVWEQFPCESKLTSYIGLGQNKIILMRPYVMPQTGGFHDTSYSLAKYYKKHPLLHKTYHFKWHGNVLNSMRTYNYSVNARLFRHIINGHSLIVARKPLLYYPKVILDLFNSFLTLGKLSLRRLIDKDYT